MAEATATVGFAASLLQLIDFSAKILSRLDEYRSGMSEVPVALRQFNNTLPLLCDTLQEIQKAADAGSFKTHTKVALTRAVDGCHDQLRQADSILAKYLPRPQDSRLQRGVKAISSIGQDGKIERISKDLQIYIHTLTFYCTAVSSTRQLANGKFLAQYLISPIELL